MLSREVRAFEFDRYPDYLKVVGERYLTRRRRALTLEQWAKRLGYRSPRSVAMVLKGQRLPSSEMIEAISRDLEHSPEEHRYFELLVLKEKQLKKKRDISRINEELARLSPKQTNDRKLSVEAFEYIADWYHFVVKQLVESPGFKNDVKWMKQRLRNKVSVAEIEKAMRTLAKLRFIKKENGRWISSRESIDSTFDVPSSAIRQHHREMMLRAIEALDEQEVLEREITSLTFRMDRKRLPQAKQAIRDFREGFMKRFESHSADDIFQCNIQLFQHSVTRREQ